MNGEREFEKDNHREDDASASGWETIYCSLVLILVALFVMLVSYSSVEKSKMASFMRGFVVSAATESKDRISATVSKDSSGSSAIESAMESLEKYLEEAGVGGSVSVEKTERGFKTTLGSDILFPTGVATVNKEAYAHIDQMILAAQKTPFSIRIEGHTDNVPINTPEFPSNWELSTARAVNVLRYFLERGNISAKRLVAVGFSQCHPIASNKSAEGRWKNRRVEFYFELKEDLESS